MTEVIYRTYSNPVRIQRMGATEEIRPELIFVISAHPDIAGYTIIDAGTSGVHGPGVMPVCWGRVGREIRKIDTSIAIKELPVRMKVTIAFQTVYGSALANIVALIGPRVVQYGIA